MANHEKKRETDASTFRMGEMPEVKLDDSAHNIVEGIHADALHDGYAAALAFNEEVMEVMLHETGDLNAENPVLVGVQGEYQHFLRGVPTKAKRKFVDALIVKTSNVSTPAGFNQHSGEMIRKVSINSALKFPFAVINDPNPKGVEWLRRRLAEAV